MEDNRHCIEDRLTDEYGTMLWFRIIFLNELKEYGFYKKRMAKEFKKIEKYNNLEDIIQIIRTMFQGEEEAVLEVKIENEIMKKYVEYMDNELYVYEKFSYNPFNIAKNTFEIYSKSNNNYLETKEMEFQQEVRELQNIGKYKLSRKLKKSFGLK